MYFVLTRIIPLLIDTFLCLFSLFSVAAGCCHQFVFVGQSHVHEINIIAQRYKIEPINHKIRNAWTIKHTHTLYTFYFSCDSSRISHFNSNGSKYYLKSDWMPVKICIVQYAWWICMKSIFSCVIVQWTTGYCSLKIT